MATNGRDIIELTSTFSSSPQTVEVAALGGNDDIIFHWIRDFPEGDDPPRDKRVKYEIDGGPGLDTLIFFVEDDPEFNNDDVLDARTGEILGVEFTSIERVELYGANGNDSLFGLAGDDVLNGQGQSDTMTGGLGNDLYYANVSSDVIVENEDEGQDTVRAFQNFVLPPNVEDLILLAGTSGTGNGLDNYIRGNDAVNTLSGLGGDDTLDGKGGADTMRGGLGDDTYIVNNSADKVEETSAAGGIDTVQSSASFTLGANVENLVQIGTGNISGTGNSLGNAIAGNSGDNTLRGLGGADLLKGNSGDDAIDGGSGDDRIYGGGGNDELEGGAGRDRFYFTSTPSPVHADVITDFSTSDDLIYLARYAFTNVGGGGRLDADAFRTGSAAADAEDRIIYDAATGNLFYDADGTGAIAQQLFARVDPGLALTNADFIVYG